MDFVNSIGNHQFISMERPANRRQNVTYESYTGTDDYSIWTDAMRGTPMSITTQADFDSFDAADAALAEYEAMQGSGPFPVTWAGIERQFDVFVDRVRGDAKAIVLGIGGLSSAARAIVVATWMIVPLPKATT